MKEKGQVVVLLLLVMVVALAIGLSMISRSVLEVSTSRKSEDSSRAFSAAEAGIEKVIQANLNNLGNTPIGVGAFSLGNQASANIVIPDSALPRDTRALEYPPFGKESFAQFWLVNPNFVTTQNYNGNLFYIYFGDPDISKYTSTVGGNPADQPAIEVNIISWDVTNNKYLAARQYFDSVSGSLPVTGRPSFTTCDQRSLVNIPTNDNTAVSFYCRVTVSITNTPNYFPVMVRVRVLYSNISHPVALGPKIGLSLPKQVNIYQSKGTSGSVERTLEVFQQKAVMPQIYDYVLFSAKNLQKK